MIHPFRELAVESNMVLELHPDTFTVYVSSFLVQRHPQPQTQVTKTSSLQMTPVRCILPKSPTQLT